jgi:DNA-binding CsgD family transcriptional regulator
VSFSESNLRQAVCEGVARMRKRQQAEQKLAEVAREHPEIAEKELTAYVPVQRALLRLHLSEEFGFSVSRTRSGLRCRVTSPERHPRTPERAAKCIEAVVTLIGHEIAWDAMLMAAAYFAPPDQARKVCDAFLDVMRETPAVYAAFATGEEDLAPGAKEHAAATAAAFVRSHLKSYPSTKAVLEGPNWASELVKATLLAFQELDELDELDSNSPIKRSARFRDTLPKQKDGRRQKAPGPPDLINLVDRHLAGRESGQKAKPQELEFATFAEREREALLRRGREAGLPPREYEYLKLLAESPRISYSEAARELKIAKGTAKKLKHNIMKSLGVA